MMVVSVIAVVGIALDGSAAADPVSDLMVTNAASRRHQDADIAYAIEVAISGPTRPTRHADLRAVGTAGATSGSLQSSGPAMAARPRRRRHRRRDLHVTTMTVGASATLTVAVHVDAAAPRGDFLLRAQVARASTTLDPSTRTTPPPSPRWWALS